MLSKNLYGGIFFCLALGRLSITSSLVNAQTLSDPGLQVREIVAGLSSPTSMAFIGAGDILVLQKDDGRVRRVINGVLQPGQVLDVAVVNDSERGLLGIATHPNFPATPFVYLYYTESGTGGDTSGTPAPLGNRVYRYTWNGSALVSPTLILDLPATPGPNHDGGTILFGPDGKLYVVIGDQNRNGQLQNFPGGPAPDNTGVILRINDDGTIPNDNPFILQGGNLSKYYAYGVRNSFGMAFDPVTGKLWDTENGENSYDEINLVEPGFNSGWEQIMGPDARDPQGVGNLFQVPGSHYSDPEFSWLNTVAPTAIAFLNSPQLGQQYRNDVLVGDINNGRLYHFKLNAARDGFILQSAGLADLVADNDSELGEIVLGTGFGGITDLKVGPDGLLYVLSFVGGKIFVVSRKLSANCPGDVLQAVVDNALPGDLISVSGACNENVLVRNDKVRLFLDGGGTAAINGVNPNSPALDIRGKAISVNGFTITGGSSRIEVQRGANAVINNNVIQNTGGNGVVVSQLAFAVFTNNMIQNNTGDGVVVKEGSAAHIGFNNETENMTSPNVIQGNGGNGVTVAGSSSARVVGNAINTNGGDGVRVTGSSQSDIASNTIDSNIGDGVFVGQDSVVNLGEDTGTSIFELPNTTNTNNAGFGVGCADGGMADGRLGSLNGDSGATEFPGGSGCINDLL
jgi:aldose sugar dehydrogenase